MKTLSKPFLLLVTTFILFSSGLIAQTTLLTNLLCYYRLNGNFTDASGNVPDVTTNGTWTTDWFGGPNRAIALNSALAQTITLPNVNSLHPQLPMSVAFDALFTSFGCNAFANDFAPLNYYGIWVGVDAQGRTHVNFGDGGSPFPAQRRSKSAGILITPNVWHNFVCVIRSSTDMDIYIDCANAKGNYSGSGGALTYLGNAGVLGAATSSSGATYMSGKLDRIAFWSRALTASDVGKYCNGNLDQLLRTTGASKWSSDITLYPNPTSDVLKLQIPEAEGAALELQILNEYGKWVRTENVFGDVEYALDVHSLPVGTYYLKVNAECEDPVTMRFLVNR